MKAKRLWIPLAALALVLLAFGLLDFRLAQSQTTTQHQITTSSIGDDLPVAMRSAPALAFAVTGKSHIVPALREALYRELQASGRFTTVTQLKGVPVSTGQPYLLVEIDPQAELWTPLYTQARLKVTIHFASDGDLSFLEQIPAVMDNANGPQLESTGELTLDDRSWGLISYPGYATLLANQMAPQLQEALTGIYQSK